ncbi:hypothetical protein [Geodermatophilus sp. SYSU D01119]
MRRLVVAALAALLLAVALLVVVLPDLPDGPGGGAGTPTAPATADPPGPALRGWELDAGNTGLRPFGLTCEELPLYTGAVRPAAGTVIEQRRVTTPLDLSNGGITITRSCVQPTSVGRGLPVLTTTHLDDCSDETGCPAPPSRVTISWSEIDGSLLSPEEAAMTTGFLGIADLRGNHVHDVGSGIGLVNTGRHLSSVVERNYVTGLRAHGNPATDGNHSDAFTIRDFDTSAEPGRTLLVADNRFDCSSGSDTGALFVQTWSGDIDNVRITGNLLEGGGYQLGLNQDFGSSYGDVVAVDNRFSGTGYGAAYVQGGAGWTRWADNHLDDPARPEHRGEPVAAP